MSVGSPLSSKDTFLFDLKLTTALEDGALCVLGYQ